MDLHRRACDGHEVRAHDPASSQRGGRGDGRGRPQQPRAVREAGRAPHGVLLTAQRPIPAQGPQEPDVLPDREPRPHDQALGPTHHLPVNAPGRLGYTYPNPVELPGNRIWLSWRGGNWLPTYSVLKRGRWSAAREIVRGPRRQRPYAKYAAGPPGSGIVHIAFTETHPAQSRTHVHYVQYRMGRGFFRIDGKRVGGPRDLPLAGSRTDVVHDYDEAEGRSWVMDVADDGAGNPVIAYSVGFGRRKQSFRSARWTGDGWLDRHVSRAYATRRHGGAAGAFQTGGIVLDHRDPSIAYLSRVIRDRGEVELWHTTDQGGSWSRVRRLSPRGKNCYRPAAPVNGPFRVVMFVCGHQSHWTRYATTVQCSTPIEPLRATALRADGCPR